MEVTNIGRDMVEASLFQLKNALYAANTDVLDITDNARSTLHQFLMRTRGFRRDQQQKLNNSFQHRKQIYFNVLRVNSGGNSWIGFV